jgi:hypothetical protein
VEFVAALQQQEPDIHPGARSADDLKEAFDTINVLAEENEALKIRLAVECSPGTEEEKTAAADLIDALRTQVRQLTIENDALKVARNTLLVESGEMQKTIAYWRRKAEKVSA